MFPNFIQIGSFILPTYGVLVTTAFLLGLWLISKLSRRAGFQSDAVMNLAIYAAIAGMVGAKLLMILMDLGFYLRNPAELFSITTLQAGGVFYGGLLLALVVSFLYMRAQKLPGLATADVFAPAVALGHGIGRLGCLSAGCCYGAKCGLPWAVTFTNPRALEVSGTPLNIPLHPTQLYEAAAEFVIFAILYRQFSKPHRPGAIIGLYLMLYPAVRFAVEFVRDHDKANPYYGPFVLEQWIALGLFALGGFLMSRRTEVRTAAVKK